MTSGVTLFRKSTAYTDLTTDPVPSFEIFTFIYVPFLFVWLGGLQHGRIQTMHFL